MAVDDLKALGGGGGGGGGGEPGAIENELKHRVNMKLTTTIRTKPTASNIVQYV